MVDKLSQFDDSEDGIVYKIIGICRELVADGEITEEKGEELEQMAKNDQVTEALDELEEIVSDEDEEELLFDEEEKNEFAEAFQDAINELESSIVEFREELQSLEKGVNRGDMRQYLYGGKSARTYDDVDDLFDAIDSVSGGGISDRKMAKILSAYTSRLNITETEELISEMREK